MVPSPTFSAEGFSEVRGIQKLPDGRGLVAEQTEEALYRIDFETQERTLLDGWGEGPGEYRAPTGLHPFRGDSVLTVDLQNGRLAIVSMDGTFGRTAPLRGRGTTIPKGSDRRGNRYWDRGTAMRMQKRTNPRANRAPIVRYDPDAEDRDSLAYLTIPGVPNPNASAARVNWAVGPDGPEAIVRKQDKYRLDWVAPDGTFRMGEPVEDFRRSSTPPRTASTRAVGEGTRTDAWWRASLIHPHPASLEVSPVAGDELGGTDGGGVQCRRDTRRMRGGRPAAPRARGGRP